MTVLTMLVISLVSSLYHGTQAAPSQLAAYHYQPSLAFRATSMDVGAVDLSSQCSCPNTRSLLDIIWRCLTTVILCTWVSVHPNLPPLEERRWRGVLRRLKVMFWGLVAPELILGWSIRQWMMARKIGKENAHREEDLGTLSYALFKDLLMAGDINFPVVLREDIEDKSKGDPLTKALVIVQTTWFIVQCIARAVLGLPITELEIVTLAFCSLNAIVYFFWWHKPLGIERRAPIYLKPDSSYRPDSKSKDTGEVEEVDPISTEVPDDTSREKTVVKSLTEHTTSSLMNGRSRFFIHDRMVAIRRGIRSYFRKLCDIMRKDIETRNILLLVLFIWPIKRPLASVFYLLGRFVLDFIINNITAILGDQDSENIVPGIKRVNTFYSPRLEETDDLATSILYSLIGCAFGALHCISWNFHFPTHAERSLWRSLSLIITFSPLALLFFYFVSFNKDEDGEFRQHIGNRILRTLEFIAMLIMITLIVCYIPFRLILLIQSFISLRDVPPSALLDIDWEDYIPHL